MLDGDGQYPPEYLDQMNEPISSDHADIVFGFRMLEKDDKRLFTFVLLKRLLQDQGV